MRTFGEMLVKHRLNDEPLHRMVIEQRMIPEFDRNIFTDEGNDKKDNLKNIKVRS